MPRTPAMAFIALLVWGSYNKTGISLPATFLRETASRCWRAQASPQLPRGRRLRLVVVCLACPAACSAYWGTLQPMAKDLLLLRDVCTYPVVCPCWGLSYGCKPCPFSLSLYPSWWEWQHCSPGGNISPSDSSGFWRWMQRVAYLKYPNDFLMSIVACIFFCKHIIKCKKLPQKPIKHPAATFKCLCLRLPWLLVSTLSLGLVFCL